MTDRDTPDAKNGGVRPSPTASVIGPAHGLASSEVSIEQGAIPPSR